MSKVIRSRNPKSNNYRTELVSIRFSKEELFLLDSLVKNQKDMNRAKWSRTDVIMIALNNSLDCFSPKEKPISLDVQKMIDDYLNKTK